MCGFQKKQNNAANDNSKEQVIPIWVPDRSLPYVLHIPGKEEQERLPFVCIWPKVIRYTEANMRRDIL